MHHPKIIVFGSRRQYQYYAQVRQLILSLCFDGASVAMHSKLYDALTLENNLSLPGVERVHDCDRPYDLALSIGGDGTFLRTINQTLTRSIPVLGINTGHLGYLTAMSIDRAISETDTILESRFRKEHLTTLQVTSDFLPKPLWALNDIVISKEDTASMITASATLNNNPLADYRADGLIVATPTGSTAYNLSVGGPIVQPGAPVMILSPIAAHSLTLRPLVISDSTQIGVKVSGRCQHYRLAVDGKAVSMPIDTSLTIQRSPYRVTALYMEDSNFASIIGQKLLFNG